MIPFAFRVFMGGVALSLLAACSSVPSPSPEVTTAWRDPAFNGPPFRKVFVVGMSAQSLVDQRGFENLLVSALRDAGTAALPAWQYLHAGLPPGDSQMRTAVDQSQADALLIVRVSDVSNESTLGYGVGGLRSAGANMYVGWYEPSLVTNDHRAATVYATLFDVRTRRAVWTYNPPTFSPSMLAKYPSGFAQDVVARLRTSALIAP